MTTGVRATTVAVRTLLAVVEAYPDLTAHQNVLDLQQDIVAFQRGEERAPRRTYAAGSVVVREGEPGAPVRGSGHCGFGVWCCQRYSMPQNRAANALLPRAGSSAPAATAAAC